jgi:predicted metal-dependent hydrolase
LKKQVRFGKSVIQYNLIKTKRSKTSEISVDKDNVIVRVPTSKSDSEIKNILKEKSNWIYKKQIELKNQKSSIAKPTFSEDTTIPYFGKNCILKIELNRKKNLVKFVNSRFIISLIGKRPLKKEVQKAYDEWLMVKAEKYLETRTVKLGTKTALKPSKIQVKSLKGKWGNASNGTIILNSNLMKCSKDTIDYIIIHELCHLKINNHSHRYWNLVRKHYPKYEEKVKELEILSRIVL